MLPFEKLFFYDLKKLKKSKKILTGAIIYGIMYCYPQKLAFVKRNTKKMLTMGVEYDNIIRLLQKRKQYKKKFFEN